MAKKLKTFQTSLGFYDLAIAAPSMKAALEAWGADSNLFHQGAAKESGDPEIVEATMAKPGVVLRRPVGSDDAFTEHAALPTHISSDRVAKGRPRPARRRRRLAGRLTRGPLAKLQPCSRKNSGGATANGARKKPPSKSGGNGVNAPLRRPRPRSKKPSRSTIGDCQPSSARGPRSSSEPRRNSLAGMTRGRRSRPRYGRHGTELIELT